jgi:acyl carrier protein
LAILAACRNRSHQHKRQAWHLPIHLYKPSTKRAGVRRGLLATSPMALHNQMMDAILPRLQEIFRVVLLDDTLILTPETSGKDFEAWDSLTHVTLMVHAERAFKIQFTSSEIAGWQNAGELAKLIENRLQPKG